MMKNDYRQDLFTELHKDLPKLGPGSTESTRKVFNLLKLPPRPTIVDVGCDTGRTTIELAKISNGKIIALDINQVFLDILISTPLRENTSASMRYSCLIN
jgi:cyclopropane fatty-acyl-phospholipid synthase-like methyltransferase